MTTKRTMVTPDEAHKLLNYDPETGVFTWKRNSSAAKIGDVAGYVHRSGYRRIGVAGALVYAHRLAWLMHHGEPPSDMIDHINGDKDDNRIANLRDVDALRNAQNKRNLHPSAPPRNTLVGVFASRDGARWSAQTTFMGKTVRCGNLQSMEEALLIYDRLCRALSAAEDMPVTVGIDEGGK